MNVLFVCERNVARSPMAAELLGELLRGRGRHETRSVGMAPDAARRVTTRDVVWADVIAVMEEPQRVAIAASWPSHAHKVVVLGVGDDYDPDEPELRSVLVPKIRALAGRVTVDHAGGAGR